MPSSEVPYPGMPIKQIQTRSQYFLIRALQNSGKWEAVYSDEYQHLFVNTDSEQGKKLLEDVENGTAVFPDEFSQHFTLAGLYLKSENPALARKGMDSILTAFKLNPCPAAINRLLMETRPHAQYYGLIFKTLQEYLDEFIENEDVYRRNDGYLPRLGAALQAAKSISRQIKTQDTERYATYRNFIKAHADEPRMLAEEGKW
jgi:hypothetical protein